MRLIIADTGPVNYLILIDQIHVLSTLFEKVILPSAVMAELTSSNAPLVVRSWVAQPPRWLEVQNVSGDFDSDPLLRGIHRGERAAIALATNLSADLLLMDDRKGVHLARRKGLRVTGTLGILQLAAQEGLLNFEQAVQRLQETKLQKPARSSRGVIGETQEIRSPSDELISKAQGAARFSET